MASRGNEDMLTSWPDDGSATLHQFERVARVHEAPERFQLVQFTLGWIDSVEWHVTDVIPPFTDLCDYTRGRVLPSLLKYEEFFNHCNFVLTQQMYKQAVKTMKLDQERKDQRGVWTAVCETFVIIFWFKAHR
ncbi:unnamed protein product [Phytophthora lilii]|uniref:Unnamed protein product n=1 Tax=Phytophthora lilii TaxID=2077276 RepID=A0A9W6WPV5_9STRA|nr:unnamed protein product [Phytophthora lilii]